MIFPFKCPFIGDFPLPRLLTPEGNTKSDLVSLEPPSSHLFLFKNGLACNNQTLHHEDKSVSFSKTYIIYKLNLVKNPLVFPCDTTILINLICLMKSPFVALFPSWTSQILSKMGHQTCHHPCCRPVLTKPIDFHGENTWVSGEDLQPIQWIHQEMPLISRLFEVVWKAMAP